VNNYRSLLSVHRRLGSSHYHRLPLHTLLVMGSASVALFCIMLILWYIGHDVLDVLSFVCGSFV
jgi:hypothetical protein